MVDIPDCHCGALPQVGYPFHCPGAEPSLRVLLEGRSCSPGPVGRGLDEAARLGPHAVDSGWLDGLGSRAGDHLAVRQWGCAGGVLHEPVEQLAARGGMATVEPEAELVKVGLHVLWLNAALVRAQ